MYIILVYDVNVKRVNKVLKIARKYLTWVQNSVLEGELTEATLKKLQRDLSKVIDPNEDALIFYKLPDGKNLSRETIGTQKGKETWVL
ncbi:CRISPR-associated endonuclease Cas2 [Pseudothermotoga thermarum]|uniref:CRISPR-associated endoribonuclease Cas2 n=1 Tax=Pseudothermotoga thermarum DSM 5069 TaxID=688269 RepID=F7YTL4_9THEM|nr:CRISPR-associated endonuclease Cas2 [Pseudothermotoga thermarum]AEH51236.1 CRISPR-associated protein, Cas2 family [Pseudothermotoga thermarum DSM 5069]